MRRPHRLAHTYSIVALDKATGRLGVAVQSHYFSVGPVVPWVESGVGAVATQAEAEVSYGRLGLDLMRGGKTAKWQVLFAVRIIAGYVLPGVVWVLSGPAHYELIVSGVLVGEIVDRTEFYLELDFTRPEALAKSDLDRVIASKPLVLT